MNTYKDILRAEVVNMALEFVINLDAKKRLMQVIDSLPEESEVICENCGAKKTPCQYVCLECEWTYPDIDSASGYPGNIG